MKFIKLAAKIIVGLFIGFIGLGVIAISIDSENQEEAKSPLLAEGKKHLADFCQAVDAHRNQYEDIASGPSYLNKEKDLRDVVSGRSKTIAGLNHFPEFKNWPVEVSAIYDGYLEFKLGCDTFIAATEFTPEFLEQIAELRSGSDVLISGQLIRSLEKPSDLVERSVTESGSMEEPEYSAFISMLNDQEEISATQNISPMLAKREEEFQLCEQDARCYAEKHLAEATIFCKQALEKYPKYGFEWDDSMFTPAFGKVVWTDQEAKTLRFIGDKLRVKNVFGVFAQHTYQCEYDALNATVMSAHIISR